MLKFDVYYGILDDFARGPKMLKISIRGERKGYVLLIKRSGIELRWISIGKPYYKMLKSFYWGKHA